MMWWCIHFDLKMESCCRLSVKGQRRPMYCMYIYICVCVCMIDHLIVEMQGKAANNSFRSPKPHISQFIHNENQENGPSHSYHHHYSNHTIFNPMNPSTIHYIFYLFMTICVRVYVEFSLQFLRQQSFYDNI